MRPLLLINPNTNSKTTQEMVEIAQRSAGPGQRVEGATAASGAPLISDSEKLSASAAEVISLARQADPEAYSGIIISAFGDPGLGHLQKSLSIPVTGIAEAGIIEAVQDGRRFSIVTTTPDLVAAIGKLVENYGYAAQFAGVRLTEGDVDSVMSQPALLEASLAAACRVAILEDAAEAIIIGGGPLAVHAAALRSRFSVPIIEPVPAAVRLAVERARALAVSGHRVAGIEQPADRNAAAFAGGAGAR